MLQNFFSGNFRGCCGIFISKLQLGKAGFILLVCLMCLPCTSAAKSGFIRIIISDMGLNQWSQDLVLGADFKRSRNKSFHVYKAEAQILIPMPDDNAWGGMRANKLQQSIEKLLVSKILNGYKQGISTFEVRIVQNVETGNIDDANRQRLNKLFGRYVYIALRKSFTKVEKELHVPVKARAIMRNVGIQLLAENYSKLSSAKKPYLDNIDLFDNAAYYADTENIIQYASESKVRLFFDFGKNPNVRYERKTRTVARVISNSSLKDRHPQIGVFYLKEMPAEKRPKAEKTDLFQQKWYEVSEYIGEGQVRVFEGLRTLNQALTAEYTKTVTRRIRVEYEITKKLLISLSTLLSLFDAQTSDYRKLILDYLKVNKEASEQMKNVLFDIKKKVPDSWAKHYDDIDFYNDIYTTIAVIAKDVEKHRDGEFVFVQSETLQSLGELSLSILRHLDIEKKIEIGESTTKVIKASGGLAKISLATAEMLGSGKVSADPVGELLVGLLKIATVHSERVIDMYDAGKGNYTLAQYNNAKYFMRYTIFFEPLKESAMALYKAHTTLEDGKTGRFSEEEVFRHIFNLTNTAVWTLIGFTACGPNLMCVWAVQQFGVSLGDVFYKWNKDAIWRWMVRDNETIEELIEGWRSAQIKRIFEGRKILSITEFYRNQDLKLIGFHGDEIESLNHDAYVANSFSSLDAKITMISGHPASVLRSASDMLDKKTLKPIINKPRQDRVNKNIEQPVVEGNAGQEEVRVIVMFCGGGPVTAEQCEIARKKIEKTGKQVILIQSQRSVKRLGLKAYTPDAIEHAYADILDVLEKNAGKKIVLDVYAPSLGYEGFRGVYPKLLQLNNAGNHSFRLGGFICSQCASHEALKPPWVKRNKVVLEFADQLKPETVLIVRPYGQETNEFYGPIEITSPDMDSIVETVFSGFKVDIALDKDGQPIKDEYGLPVFLGPMYLLSGHKEHGALIGELEDFFVPLYDAMLAGPARLKKYILMQSEVKEKILLHVRTHNKSNQKRWRRNQTRQRMEVREALRKAEARRKQMENLGQPKWENRRNNCDDSSDCLADDLYNEDSVGNRSHGARIHQVIRNPTAGQTLRGVKMENSEERNRAQQIREKRKD